MFVVCKDVSNHLNGRIMFNGMGKNASSDIF